MNRYLAKILVMLLVRCEEEGIITIHRDRLETRSS